MLDNFFRRCYIETEQRRSPVGVVPLARWTPFFYCLEMNMREGEFRNPSGCAISAIFDKKGNRFSGADIVKSISVMHDRSNGLGGGFAGYGIYPEYKDYFAFHIFYDSPAAKRTCEEYLETYYDIKTYDGT